MSAPHYSLDNLLNAFLDEMKKAVKEEVARQIALQGPEKIPNPDKEAPIKDLLDEPLSSAPKFYGKSEPKMENPLNSAKSILRKVAERKNLKQKTD